MNKATRLKTMAAALGVPTCRLRDLELAGIVVRRPDGAFDIDKNRARYDLYRRADLAGLNEAVLHAAAEADQAIAAVDPAARGFKRAARRVERALIDLNDVLRLAKAMRPDDARLILDLRNKLLSRARGAMAARVMEHLEREPIFIVSRDQRGGAANQYRSANSEGEAAGPKTESVLPADRLRPA